MATRKPCIKFVALLCAAALVLSAENMAIAESWFPGLGGLHEGLVGYWSFDTSTTYTTIGGTLGGGTGTTVYVNIHDMASQDSHDDDAVIYKALNNSGSWEFVDGPVDVHPAFNESLRLVNTSQKNGYNHNWAHIPFDQATHELDMHSQLTISMWVYLTSYQSGSRTIGSILDSGVDGYNIYTQYSSGGVRFKVSVPKQFEGDPSHVGTAICGIPVGGATTSTKEDPDFSRSTWHHILATYDGTGTTGVVKLYWDGVLKADEYGEGGTDSYVDLTGTLSPNWDGLSIGTMGFYSTQLDWLPEIRVDDLGIWDRMLTEGEIDYINSHPIDGTPEPSSFVMLLGFGLGMLAYAWAREIEHHGAFCS